jgi:DNA-binding winged helix-turn-helix (wHTH) protein
LQLALVEWRIPTASQLLLQESFQSFFSRIPVKHRFNYHCRRYANSVGVKKEIIMVERIYQPTITAKQIRLGDWTLCVHTNSLACAEKKVELEHRLVLLLLFFIDHAQEILTKDALIKAVWPGKVVNEDSLSVAISHLRKALADNARAPRYIKTIPGIGYQFIAHAEPLVDAIEQSTARVNPDFSSEPSSESSSSSVLAITHTRRVKPLPWVLMASFLLVAFGFYFGIFDKTKVPDEPLLVRAQQALTGADEKSWRVAIELFRQSLTHNPDQAEAYLGIAQAKIKLLRDQLAIAEHCAEVKGLLDKAIEWNPALATAWIERGNVSFWCLRDLQAAEQYYREAMRLVPQDDVAPMQYAQLLLAQGRFDESRQQMEISRQRNPLNYSVPLVVWIYQMQRRDDLAYTEWLRVTTAEPANRFYDISAQRVLASLGREQESFVHWQKVMRTAGYADDELHEVKRIFEQGGLPAVNRWLLMRKDEANLGHYEPPLSWARYALAAGELEIGLHYLEQAAALPQSPLLWAGVDPAYDPVRDHPRFRAILAQVLKKVE